MLELLTEAAGGIRLSPAEAEQVVAWLGLRDLDSAAKALPADSAAVAELRALFEWLDAYGLADRVEFDASVVRGLAYYTGVVFEAFDAARRLRSICGGGRYDRLLETLGGRPLPATGFGFGDAVIAELLAEKKLLPELARDLDAVVVALAEDAGSAEAAAAIRLARQLRGAGESVELVLEEPRLKRALARADRAGAARIYWIGADELRSGRAKVRDLRSGDQSEVEIPAA